MIGTLIVEDDFRVAQLHAEVVEQHEGFAVHALSFSYGQRHATEIEAARRIARNAGVVQHRVIDIDLTVFGGSALTSAALRYGRPVYSRGNSRETGAQPAHPLSWCGSAPG